MSTAIDAAMREYGDLLANFSCDNTAEQNQDAESALRAFVERWVRDAHTAADNMMSKTLGEAEARADRLFERLTQLRQLIATVLAPALRGIYSRQTVDAMLEPFDRIEQEMRDGVWRQAPDYSVAHAITSPEQPT